MKYIVAIKTDKYLKQLKQLNVSDVIVSDSYFSSSTTDYDIEKTLDLIHRVKESGLGCIVRLDRLYDQKELNSLKQYLALLAKNQVDALLFSDIGVKVLVEQMQLNLKTIYAPETLLTNYYDIEVLKNNGLSGCVISKDIPYSEMLAILNQIKGYCYLRVFGEVLISYSKRRFVSVYLDQYQPYKTNYYLQEENRAIKMPLVEKESGFWLYGYMLHSLDKIKEIISSEPAGIILDQVFMDDEYQLEVVKIYNDVSGGIISWQMGYEKLLQLSDKLNYQSISDVKQTVLEKQ
ncbi:MAG: U32 family peptidase [Erysipelotrichaceae bacterium]